MNHENECAQERTAAAAKRRRQCQQMLLRAIDAAGSHYCFDRVRLAVLPAAAATVDRITGDATTKACAAKKYASSATTCNNVVRRTLDLVPRARLGTSEARPRTQFVSRLTTFVHHFPAPANCLPHAAAAFCVFFFLLLWCAMSNILAQSCISRCLAETRAKRVFANHVWCFHTCIGSIVEPNRVLAAVAARKTYVWTIHALRTPSDIEYVSKRSAVKLGRGLDSRREPRRPDNISFYAIGWTL